MPAKTKKKSERWEILMRIFVAIITGIILAVWKIVVVILTIVQIIIVLIKGKRNRDFVKFNETWNTQNYVFTRYLLFISNERPFPFESLTPNMSKFE